MAPASFVKSKGKDEPMRIKKINRGRQQAITFLDAKGIRRELVVLRNEGRPKKPPAWMQEMMQDLQELEKGA